MNGHPPLRTVNILKTNPLLHVVAWLFFLSIFVFPPVTVCQECPAVYGTDFLFPVLCLLLLSKLSQIRLPQFRRMLITTSLLTGCVLLSMCANGRMSVTTDWFEVYKLMKFGVAVLYVALFVELRQVEIIMKTVLVLVLVFNTLHYFDVFGFNSKVMPYYAQPEQLEGFGLNSLGMPDTRRLIGTSSNPNNNALLCLFLVVWFARKSYSRADRFFFYASVLLVLGCQSRTGFAALVLVLVLIAVCMRQSLKAVLIDLAVYTGMYLLLLLGGNVYLSSLGNFGRISDSFREGRIAMWMKLLHMWKSRPLLGYGPSKEVFYRHHWYPEGEYILMLWRYGIVGLIAYLAWILNPLTQAYAKFKTGNVMAFRLVAFTVVLLTGAVTNVPTLDFSLLMQFSMMFGLFLGLHGKIIKEEVYA